MTTPRANGLTGTMSLSPTLVSVVKLRYSSSIQRAIGVRLDLRGEAAGLDRLDDDIEVGERPRHEREGGADRPHLVAGDDVVGEHVGDQRPGRVEVEDRLEAGGVGLKVLAAGRGLDQQQHASPARRAAG